MPGAPTAAPMMPPTDVTSEAANAMLHAGGQAGGQGGSGARPQQAGLHAGPCSARTTIRIHWTHFMAWPSATEVLEVGA